MLKPWKKTFWIGFGVLFIIISSIFLADGWWEDMNLEGMKDNEVLESLYYYRSDNSDNNTLFIRSLKDSSKLNKYYENGDNSVDIYDWHRSPIIKPPVSEISEREYNIIGYTEDKKFAIVKEGKLNPDSNIDDRKIFYISSKFLYNSPQEENSLLRDNINKKE